MRFVVLTLWDYLTQGAIHTYGLRSSPIHAWYLLYGCDPVLEGEAGFAKSPAQEIAVHKQFVQKETGHYYASLARPCKADMLTICLVKLISVLLNYKVKDNLL